MVKCQADRKLLCLVRQVTHTKGNVLSCARILLVTLFPVTSLGHVATDLHGVRTVLTLLRCMVLLGEYHESEQTNLTRMLILRMF